MSSAKSKKTIDPKKALSQLKKFGLLTDIDARKTLTDSQKRKIKNNYQKFERVLETPKSEFLIKDVSHYENFEKKQLVQSGYLIINNKVYVDKQGAKKIVLERSLTKYDKKKSKQNVMIKIKRTFVDKHRSKEEIEYATTNIEAMALRDRLIYQYQNGDFEPGEFIGLKLYEGGAFRRVMWQNIDDVFKYAEFDFAPHDESEREELQNNMRLVRMKMNHYTDRDIGMRSKKEVNKVRRARSAVRKTVKAKAPVKRK